MDNKKILVIENQWSEFEKIAECLTDVSYKDKRNYTYDVLMSSADNDTFNSNINKMHEKFTSFADKIRIWVNTGYNEPNDETYREKAFEEIEKMAGKADLIIMDHILGGAFGCKTGIDIATELAKKNILNDKPVLFLSKTDAVKTRVEAYDEYKKKYPNTEWIHKGFFGDEILKPDYIQEQVVKKGVEKLLKKINKTSETVNLKLPKS